MKTHKTKNQQLVTHNPKQATTWAPALPLDAAARTGVAPTSRELTDNEDDRGRG